ncbi:hypothetical protein MKK69_22880 [Methylobacterium sp. J-026]|jgi:hypothetical protein|uniref:hypothetical protein n=1 Tax=unclassified Methylobacterium TaxID=2615210 RepID=UPI0011C77A6A|nr:MULTISPECIES: hypothetical protein [unclassified Methylobacterium]MCJ2136860.1 hypothetical protein [Methylobacterium sp. J-026]TXM71124.1 hypothetical protein FV229_00130 [Methylobacterium sp. WL120]
MKRAVRFLRVCLRDAFPLVVDRITAAGTLGPMGLALAHVEASDTLQILMVWWGSVAGIYGLLLLASAPADPDA